MRLHELLRETWAATWASKVSSALMAIVVATMCFAALMTVGRTAAAAADIAQRMEQAGARRLSVLDTRQQGFVNPRTLAVVRQLSTVQSANALGVPFDVVNGHVGRGGIRVAAWPVLGDLTTTATLIRGRWPQPGEAIVSTTQLGKLSFGAAMVALAAGGIALVLLRLVPAQDVDGADSLVEEVFYHGLAKGSRPAGDGHRGSTDLACHLIPRSLPVVICSSSAS